MNMSIVFLESKNVQFVKHNIEIPTSNNTK